MVTGASWKRPDIDTDGFPKFSIKATESLQKIISETNASIVLTTSHKFKYDLNKWKSIFSHRGINNVEINRLADNTTFLDRKEEIMKQLKENDINNYVIIDDDKSLNGLPPNIKSRLVQTSSTVGLNIEHALKAIELLHS